ncbi:diacylglycerol/lipid kinase family protein [Haliea sp. E17]|uniref:diacylglycerol/lipid kinase family protein n=1 Tax=Haliea sp. E17 TaxID=3401576 RepID=UPI003AAF0EE5
MSDRLQAVGLISNPRSGHNRDAFSRVQARVAQSPDIYHRITDSPQDIRPALQEMRERGIVLLAINGGDGTCSAVLGEMLESGLFPEPPPIVLLPGGTANMNAGDIGVTGALQRAVERFCDWCDSGREDRRVERQRRSLMRLACPGESAPRYGMFLGAGAILQGTDYAHRELHSRGLRDDFSLALGTARTAWGLLRNDPLFRQPVAMELDLDQGGPRHFDGLLFACSTLQRLSFGMRPFWGGGEGALRATLLESDCRRFATTFVSILRGRPNRNATPESGYHSWNAQTLTLDQGGRLNLDGEVFTPGGPVGVTASAQLEFLRL